MSVVEGASAPGFTLPISADETRSLADYKGRKLVIFFYPKDSTPGCTTEAISFTEHKADFEDENCAILGISRDSLKRHENFIKKNDLGVELGSDEDGTVCNAFGVWVEKKNYGKTYMGIERSTFLIDENGNLAQIWRKVRVKGHVEAVLEAGKGA